MAYELTICVGDIDGDVVQHALSLDPNAYFIGKANAKNLSPSPGVAYTSLGDFDNIYDFLFVLKQATNLIYVETSQWSDQSTAYEFYSMEKSTLVCLHICRSYFKIPVQNLPDLPNLIQNPLSPRQTQTNQIWICGCSVSHGLGVKPDQRYGALIEESMNLPASYLTCPGSSIDWAADQILSSDIRCDDIVIWGLTDCTRYQLYRNWKHYHITVGQYAQHDWLQSLISIDLLGSHQILFQSLAKINQVKRFCQNAKVRLFLVDILSPIELGAYLVTDENFISVSDFANDSLRSYLDYGDDKRHPGPLTHQLYAKKILQKLSK